MSAINQYSQNKLAVNQENYVVFQQNIERLQTHPTDFPALIHLLQQSVDDLIKDLQVAPNSEATLSKFLTDCSISIENPLSCGQQLSAHSHLFTYVAKRALPYLEEAASTYKEESLKSPQDQNLELLTTLATRILQLSSYIPEQILLTTPHEHLIRTLQTQGIQGSQQPHHTNPLTLFTQELEHQGNLHAELSALTEEGFPLLNQYNSLLSTLPPEVKSLHEYKRSFFINEETVEEGRRSGALSSTECDIFYANIQPMTILHSLREQLSPIDAQTQMLSNKLIPLATLIANAQGMLIEAEKGCTHNPEQFLQLAHCLRTIYSIDVLQKQYFLRHVGKNTHDIIDLITNIMPNLFHMPITPELLALSRKILNRAQQETSELAAAFQVDQTDEITADAEASIEVAKDILNCFNTLNEQLTEQLTFYSAQVNPIQVDPQWLISQAEIQMHLYVRLSVMLQRQMQQIPLTTQQAWSKEIWQ